MLKHIPILFCSKNLKAQNELGQALTVYVDHVQVNMNYMAATSGNKTMITSYASS